MRANAKRRTRNDPQVRRAQILDEAIRIIGERGYYGFAVQDLALRCGLTAGGLLYHFKTKEELFLSVLSENDRRVEADVTAELAQLPEDQFLGDTLALPAVLDLLRAIFARAIAKPELSRMFVVLRAEALHHSHPGYEFFCRRAARVLQMYARMVRPHSAEPESTARQISALMQGLQQQWLRADCGFDIMLEWDRAIEKILPD